MGTQSRSFQPSQTPSSFIGTDRHDEGSYFVPPLRSPTGRERTASERQLIATEKLKADLIARLSHKDSPVDLSSLALYLDGVVRQAREQNSLTLIGGNH